MPDGIIPERVSGLISGGRMGFLSWLTGKDRPRRLSGAEIAENRLMAEWIKEEPAEQEAALGTDDEARELIKTHRLYVAYNTHATEWRWEIYNPATKRLTFFNEYSEHKTLGDAVRASVAGER